MSTVVTIIDGRSVATSRLGSHIDGASVGPPANVNRPPEQLGHSKFPPAAVARIYRPSRSATTSGKGRTRHWRLEFERQTPPFIEPLMGWTSGDDTLTQVSLSFPTLESAIAYAERQGLKYIVDMPNPRLATRRQNAANGTAALSAYSKSPGPPPQARPDGTPQHLSNASKVPSVLAHRLSGTSSPWSRLGFGQVSERSAGPRAANDLRRPASPWSRRREDGPWEKNSRVEQPDLTGPV